MDEGAYTSRRYLLRSAVWYATHDASTFIFSLIRDISFGATRHACDLVRGLTLHQAALGRRSLPKVRRVAGYGLVLVIVAQVTYKLVDPSLGTPNPNG